MEYTIIIEKNKNGWYTGQCEQIPEAIWFSTLRKRGPAESIKARV